MASDWWMIVPGNPALSGLVIFLIAIPFLYFARIPMHGVIQAASRSIYGPLRMGSRWLFSAADNLRKRNRAVVLAHGRDEMKHTIEREFERITTMVQRDLHGYPALQRKLMDEITRIEEDYQKCGEVPPPTGQWADAVKAVANITPSNGLVEKILEDIAHSIEKVHAKSLAEYRKAYQDRHKILKGFNPFWRSLNQTLSQVDKNISGMQDSAQRIDTQMEKFEQINKKTDKAEHMLNSSAGRQFVIDTIVMGIALGAAFVNFRLISLPMSEMVGAGDYITNSLKASDVSALVIIFIEATMGFFLMESLGITHLFPKISNLSAQMQKRIFWAALIFLFVLAGIEVALAFMRDLIAAENLRLKASLSGEAATVVEAAKTSWVSNIPTAGQMVMGFILPFALAFIAIPLESFISSSRTVIGVLLVLSIRSLGFVMRVLGNIVRQIGATIIHFYDVLIFLPLMLERVVRSRGSVSGKQKKEQGGVTSFPKRNPNKRTDRSATGEI
jgi:hypothetical protein